MVLKPPARAPCAPYLAHARGPERLSFVSAPMDAAERAARRAGAPLGLPRHQRPPACPCAPTGRPRDQRARQRASGRYRDRAVGRGPRLGAQARRGDAVGKISAWARQPSGGTSSGKQRSHAHRGVITSREKRGGQGRGPRRRSPGAHNKPGRELAPLSPPHATAATLPSKYERCGKKSSIAESARASDSPGSHLSPHGRSETRSEHLTSSLFTRES